MSNTSELLYTALKSKYQYEINQSKATISIYFNNCVGIGEHPQHLEEMDKLISNIADNEDKLECLEKHFGNLDKNTPKKSCNSNVSISSGIVSNNN